MSIPLVDKRDWYLAVGKTNIPLQIVKQLMNSNAQFIIDTSSSLQMYLS